MTFLSLDPFLGMVDTLGEGLIWRCEEFSVDSASPDQLISVHTHTYSLLPLDISTYLFVTRCLAQGHGGLQGEGGVLLKGGVEERVADQGAARQDRHWRRM